MATITTVGTRATCRLKKIVQVSNLMIIILAALVVVVVIVILEAIIKGQQEAIVAQHICAELPV